VLACEERTGVVGVLVSPGHHFWPIPLAPDTLVGEMWPVHWQRKKRRAHPGLRVSWLPVHMKFDLKGTFYTLSHLKHLNSLLFVVYWICVCTKLQVSFPYLEIA